MINGIIISAKLIVMHNNLWRAHNVKDIFHFN